MKFQKIRWDYFARATYVHLGGHSVPRYVNSAASFVEDNKMCYVSANILKPLLLRQTRLLYRAAAYLLTQNHIAFLVCDNKICSFHCVCTVSNLTKIRLFFQGLGWIQEVLEAVCTPPSADRSVIIGTSYFS